MERSFRHSLKWQTFIKTTVSFALRAVCSSFSFIHAESFYLPHCCCSPFSLVLTFITFLSLAILSSVFSKKSSRLWNIFGFHPFLLSKRHFMTTMLHLSPPLLIPILSDLSSFPPSFLSFILSLISWCWLASLSGLYVSSVPPLPAFQSPLSSARSAPSAPVPSSRSPALFLCDSFWKMSRMRLCAAAWRRRMRTRHCWPSRWWSSCVFPGGRTGRRREKRQVRRERNNFEMETGRLRRSRMENRGRRAVPPRWLKETRDGRY